MNGALHTHALPAVLILYPQAFSMDKWSRCQRKQQLRKYQAWSRAFWMSLKHGVTYRSYRCPYASVNLAHWHVGRVVQVVQ